MEVIIPLILASLIDDGITGEPVDYDARLKKLVLTEKALTIWRQAKLQVSELDERLTREISAEELVVFRSIIGKMKANLEEIV